MLYSKRAFFLTIFFLFSYTEVFGEEIFLKEPAVLEFIDMMTARHGFSKTWLTDIFSKARYIKSPAQSADKPAEALDWITYSSRMISNLKIKQGMRYYRKHRNDLRMAQSVYGVPDYIIAGILGIETNFGMFKLRYRAADALASLAFFYPRRGQYFKNELEALLVYSRKHKIDPFSFTSSYAGAIGIPQFMPSNILLYAVDADNDGKADIIGNHKDAIYSVANFLKMHKWKKGKPVVEEVRLKGRGYKKYVRKNPCSSGGMATVGKLKNAGVIFPIKTVHKDKAALFALETHGGLKHYAAFENFCAVYRYNPSLRYAMAVNSLGAKLGQEKAKNKRPETTKKKRS